MIDDEDIRSSEEEDNGKELSIEDDWVFKESKLTIKEHALVALGKILKVLLFRFRKVKSYAPGCV